MPVTVNWDTKVINVPQSYLTFVSGTTYELDLNQFRLDLKALEGEVTDPGTGGMPFDDTHSHNTTVTFSGITLAHVLIIENGYTVTFQNTGSPYRVNLVGANSNVADVTNIGAGNVSVTPYNSAGLVQTAVSGLTNAESEAILLAQKLFKNRLVTDPDTGIMTLYDDNGTTPLLQWEIYEDKTQLIPYRSRGIESRVPL